MLELIAVDIDGVLLEDTFSPVLYRLTQKFHVAYTKELENNTFSQKRKNAALYLKQALNLPKDTSLDQVLNMYFEERTRYLADEGHDNPILDGVEIFVKQLSELGTALICYGGLPYNQINERFLPILEKFDRYICTNDFRPGLNEIVKNIYHLKYDEVLFIDDVNRVAKEAKKYKIPFIGMPADNDWGFQKEEMEETQVKYIVGTVKDITPAFLENVIKDQKIWSE